MKLTPGLTESTTKKYLKVFNFVVDVIHDDVDLNDVLVSEVSQDCLDIGRNVARQVVALRVVASETSIFGGIFCVDAVDELVTQTTTVRREVLLDEATLETLFASFTDVVSVDTNAVATAVAAADVDVTGVGVSVQRKHVLK